MRRIRMLRSGSHQRGMHERKQTSAAEAAFLRRSYGTSELMPFPILLSPRTTIRREVPEDD
jgi:hypothetical protein